MDAPLLSPDLYYQERYPALWNDTASTTKAWPGFANVMSRKPFVHLLSPRTWSQWFGIVVVLLLVACLTYTSSTLQFRLAMRQKNTKGSLKTPMVPYWIPGLFHSISLLDPPMFVIGLIKRFGTQKPLEVRAAWFRFTIFANPDHIKTVFRKSKQVANKSTTLFALYYLFDLPKDAVAFFRADDSGMGIAARKGSNVPAHKRINFLISHTLSKMLQGPHLQGLADRYLCLLLRDLDALDVATAGDHDGQWTEFPDLYTFLQRIIIGSSVKTIAGSKLQELHPTLVEDLALFHSYVPKFLHMLPRWLIPDTYRVRGRLLSYVKSWHAYAHQHSDCNKIGPEDPDWEPYFGTKLVRRRQQYALKMEEMTADARATEDLGLLFGATANVAPSTFWFIFQALKDPALQSRLMTEVSAAFQPSAPSSRVKSQDEEEKNEAARLDIARLVAQPLLQSVYAESLRLFVAAGISRVAEYDDINIAGYKVSKGDFLVMYSHQLALDADAWARAGRVLTKPLEEFDAERFLVAPDWTRPVAGRVTAAAGAPLPPQPQPLDSKASKLSINTVATLTAGAEAAGAEAAAAAATTTKTTTTRRKVKEEQAGSKNHAVLSDDGRRFSMDGLLGLWIPYGGGDHVCPGRHFAKQEIILTFAVLFTMFDIELAFASPEEAASVRPDMRHAPFGTLPPLGKVPFRIRRKTGRSASAL